MTIENEKVAACLKAATELLADPANAGDPSELTTRRLIAELQAEIICDLHKIDFIMKRRALLVEQLASLQRGLDFAEAGPSTKE